MTRRIPFEGIENFRDYGDYEGAGGRRLKAGLLYRSGHHGLATQADLARLAELGLGVVVDLRRANEREHQPALRWAEFGARVIDNSLEQTELEEWGDFVLRSDLTAQSFRDYMLDYYGKAPFEARHVDLYRRYFQALAETDGPVLVHCSAGKDRTGILCALTHHAAGVGEADIVDDYLLTNDMERIARRLPMMREAVEQNTGRVMSDEALTTALRVEPEYLEIAFAAMRARHGSPDGYLRDVLGLDDALRARIAERLLA
jgi:protein tyrosine/serine phosphatase